MGFLLSIIDAVGSEEIPCLTYHPLCSLFKTPDGDQVAATSPSAAKFTIDNREEDTWKKLSCLVETKATYVFMYSSLIPKKLGLNHLATNHLDVQKSRDLRSMA